jgi:anti-sigma regulatory factor (Ser/Thr protein kinase)
MPETLRLRQELTSPARARHWLEDWCVRWGCTDVAEDAVLLVSELTTNAVLHARSECTIEADFTCPRLVVSVTDGMPGELTPPDGSREHHGRGLELVAFIADRWGVSQTRRGKAIWFTLISRRG